jgi:hypothetical protein
MSGKDDNFDFDIDKWELILETYDSKMPNIAKKFIESIKDFSFYSGDDYGSKIYKKHIKEHGLNAETIMNKLEHNSTRIYRYPIWETMLNKTFDAKSMLDHFFNKCVYSHKNNKYIDVTEYIFDININPNNSIGIKNMKIKFYVDHTVIEYSFDNYDTHKISIYGTFDVYPLSNLLDKDIIEWLNKNMINGFGCSSPYSIFLGSDDPIEFTEIYLINFEGNVRTFLCVSKDDIYFLESSS